MENTIKIDQGKKDIYKKVDRLFEEIPPYQELVQALRKECKQQGYTQQATKEAIMDYFLLWKPI